MHTHTTHSYLSPGRVPLAPLASLPLPWEEEFQQQGQGGRLESPPAPFEGSAELHSHTSQMLSGKQ